MSGNAESTSASTTAGAAAPWTRRSQDTPGGGGGRVLARVVTPFVAVVPWLIMLVGQFLLLRSLQSYRVQFEMGWGELVLGIVVLMVSALVWAGLTAWSSAGTTVAGLATIAVGVAVATAPGARLVFRIGREGPVTLQSVIYAFFTPANLVPLGCLLLAAGLGAAGARRLARRRT